MKIFEDLNENQMCRNWFAPYNYIHYGMTRKTVFIPLWPIMALVVLVKETFVTLVVKHLKAIRKLREWREDLNAKRKS